jgi:hypothetical protein
MNKTHYRNVFKSDHLGSADLEDFVEQGKKLIFTIEKVLQEKNAKVAGKKIDANIAYFKEDIKPMVLNATNSKIIRNFCNSPFVDDWKNVLVELYVDDNVQMKGEKTQGVRIRQIQPKTEKPIFTEDMFERAKKANATIEKIQTSYQVSQDVEQKYKDYVTT